MIARRSFLAAPALLLATRVKAQGAVEGGRTVRIGQATPAISFLPIQAARALDSFAQAGLSLNWAVNPGGDLACLAALETGDIDLAAVGSEVLLGAVGKGQPFQMVASLMSKVSLDLVLGNKAIERTGVSAADDPLDKRLGALKGLTVGVTALGGTQDHAVRWLARQAGLDPQAAVQVVTAGPPTALRAALADGRIDAFVLSPPEGLLAEDARIGQVLVRMGDEFPALHTVPFLALAVRTPPNAAHRALTVDTLKALRLACTRLLADPGGTAGRIGTALYPQVKPAVLQAAVLSLRSGIAGAGRIDPAGIEALLAYAGTADRPRPGLWTNEYWDLAR